MVLTALRTDEILLAFYVAPRAEQSLPSHPEDILNEILASILRFHVFARTKVIPAAHAMDLCHPLPQVDQSGKIISVVTRVSPLRIRNVADLLPKRDSRRLNHSPRAQ